MRILRIFAKQVAKSFLEPSECAIYSKLCKNAYANKLKGDKMTSDMWTYAIVAGNISVLDYLHRNPPDTYEPLIIQAALNNFHVIHWLVQSDYLHIADFFKLQGASKTVRRNYKWFARYMHSNVF